MRGQPRFIPTPAICEFSNRNRISPPKTQVESRSPVVVRVCHVSSLLMCHGRSYVCAWVLTSNGIKRTIVSTGLVDVPVAAHTGQSRRLPGCGVHRQVSMPQLPAAPARSSSYCTMGPASRRKPHSLSSPARSPHSHNNAQQSGKLVGHRVRIPQAPGTTGHLPSGLLSAGLAHRPCLGIQPKGIAS